MDGALLINKHSEISSFGVIEVLQKQFLAQNPGLKRRDIPKLGHGGTLDPFATGLLAVLSGRAVKLARYFLGATKSYEGVIRFGETTIPGDPTAPISETSDQVPSSLEEIQEMARKLTLQPYLQIPPMHSAKKVDGKPLYELARKGIEIEREPKLCHLYEFKIVDYQDRRAKFQLTCSSGTYVRALAQDFGRLLGTVGMVESLHRTASGVFHSQKAMTTAQIQESGKKWDELPCWIPFDRLLDGYVRADAEAQEAQALFQGQQNVLFNILARTRNRDEGYTNLPPGHDNYVAIYHAESLVAVAHRENDVWGLERVFVRD